MSGNNLKQAIAPVGLKQIMAASEQMVPLQPFTSLLKASSTNRKETFKKKTRNSNIQF